MAKARIDAGFETLKQDKLQSRVRDSILEQIRIDAFPDGKLPPENKLAKLLGVSRATISITLAYLEREGAVVRRHGSAAYVNKGFNSIHSSINQGVGVYDLIKQNNYEPSLISNSIECKHAHEFDKGIQEHLCLTADDKVSCVQRIFAANGNPAVLTEEYIPEKYLAHPLESDNLPETIYLLSEQYCLSPIEFTLIEIVPCCVNDYLENLLRCEPEDPILLTEELHLDNKSIPIIFSNVFVLDKYIRFQAIRIRQ